MVGVLTSYGRRGHYRESYFVFVVTNCSRIPLVILLLEKIIKAMREVGVGLSVLELADVDDPVVVPASVDDDDGSV